MWRSGATRPVTARCCPCMLLPISKAFNIWQLDSTCRHLLPGLCSPFDHQNGELAWGVVLSNISSEQVLDIRHGLVCGAPMANVVDGEFESEVRAAVQQRGSVIVRVRLLPCPNTNHPCCLLCLLCIWSAEAAVTTFSCQVASGGLGRAGCLTGVGLCCRRAT